MTHNEKLWAFPFHGILLPVLILLATISLSAQLPTATILGTVKDATGGTVAGATVTVTNVDTGQARTQPTLDDGSYRFPALAVGNYSVHIEKEGFQSVQRNGLTLVVGQDAVIDEVLQVGSTGQTVTVTGEAPQVDTTSSSLGGVVNEDKISDLPLNGRNYVDLTLLQPGITQSSLTFAGTISPLGVTGTTFSSNGAPLRSNLQMLDGAIMSTVIGLNATSVIGTTLGVDGIKEYKVVTSMFSAEYGLVVGSQTTMVSKGGTNQFHGDAFEYLRNASLDARNYFDQLDTNNFNKFGTDKSLPFPGKRIPPYQRNNFGGSFGGPIKKDKTFFYGVYEGLRLSNAPPIQSTSFNKGCFYGSNSSATGPFTLNNSIPKYIDNSPTDNPYSVFIGGTNTACTTPATLNGVPNTLITVGCPFSQLRPASGGGCATAPNPAVLGAADAYWPVPNTGYGLNAAGQSAQVLSYNYTYPYKQPQSENYAQLRLDQVFNDKDSIFGRYTADLSHQTSPEAFPQWSLKYKSEGLLATVSETHILSPTVLNTARVSFSRSGLNFLDTTVPLVVDAELIPGQGFACCSVGNSVSSPSVSNTPGDVYQNIFTISDDIFVTKGKHAFKFGALVNHFSDLLDFHYLVMGATTFSNNQNFFAGDYASMSYAPFQAGYGLEREYAYNTLGFYLQDDYRAFSRLTLNLGLRYEVMTTPTAPPGLSYTVRDPKVSTAGTPDPAFLNPSLHSISPRLGFAWDVFGDGKTSLRGGGGIYYDIGNTGNLFASNETGGPPLTQNRAFTNNAFGGINSNGTLQPDFPGSLAFSFGRFGSFPLLNPANSSITLGLVNLRTIEYKLQQPTLGQWNLTLDRQLPWGTALTIAYVGTKGWHMTQLIEGNPTVPVSVGANGLPVFGCWQSTSYGFSLPSNAHQLAGANGACASGFSQAGPKTNQNCIVNIAPLTSPTAQNVQGPCWGTGLSSMNGGDTTYNGLQVGLNKRVTQGLQMQFNYTWSHALDDCVKTILDVDSTSSCQAPQADLFDDKGNSYNDIRHNIRANVIYHAPNVKSDKLYAKPLNGWWFGTIVSWQTGYPITPVNGVSHNLSANVDTVDRPNLDASFNPNTVVTGDPNHWFNASMFDLQPAGTLGNAGKGILRGPKLANADININKDTKLKWLGETGSIEFRAELFNIFNHPNFAAPSGTLTLANTISSTAAPTTASFANGAPVQYGNNYPGVVNLSTASNFGAITRTVTKSRQIQLALKVVF